MLLALETSTEQHSLCAISLQDAKQILVQETWERGQRGLFAALEKHQKILEQVKVVAVGLGPGSFSGIRISVAVAKAWRVAKEAVLIGIPSTDAIGKQFSHITRLGIFADAKRGDYYLTIYEKGICLKKSHIISRNNVEKEVGNLTLAVSAESLPEIPERAWPEAKILAKIAWKKWQKNSQGDKNLEPIYLREPVVNICK